MIILEDKATQIDDLLDRIAEEIQLDNTRYQRMMTSYEAVKDWINNDDKFFKPYSFDVYPHGSVRILTTVKPIMKDEFDLDIAIQLKSGISFDPFKIYNELKRRLSENEVYNSMMEPKKRCIRLNYTGDYHMDILPGIQESSFDNNRIKVPDRELGHWVSSNPRGYADWFLSQSNLVKQSILEKASNSERLPNDNYKYKKPLQRSVQLIKRYRDVYFHNKDQYKTSSIILTTIAGRFYQGEDSIFNTIDKIVTSIYSNVKYDFNRFKVLNPVNSDEDFTDKWESEPEYYVAFKEFANMFYSQWQEIKQSNDVIQEAVIMKKLFGESVFSNAQKSQTQAVEQLRKKSLLSISKNSGILSSSSTIGASVVKPNTFFG